MPNYRLMMLATTALCAALSLAMLLSPGLLLWGFGLARAPEALAMLHRTGAVFLGLGVLTWRLRDAADHATQRAVSIGLAVLMGAVALVGVVDLLRGATGPGVLLAVAVEVALAAGFARLVRRT